MPEILQKNYGIDQKELLQLWNSQPWFRSAATQRLLMNAMRYEIAKEGQANARVSNIPKVQRPGVVEESRRDTSAYAGARQDFNNEPSLKNAAAFLAARRAAGGQR